MKAEAAERMPDPSESKQTNLMYKLVELRKASTKVRSMLDVMIVMSQPSAFCDSIVDGDNDEPKRGQLRQGVPESDAQLPVEDHEEAEAEDRRWKWLCMRMASRKRWAVRGHMMNYAKKMPKNIDGPGVGIGAHLREPGTVRGRWGWREIPHD